MSDPKSIKDILGDIDRELPLFPSPRARLDAGERYVVTEGDAMAFLRALPDRSVDMFNFDLPYESLEKHRAVGSTTRLSHSKKSSNDWFKIFKNERFIDLFTECYRVLAPNSHLYAWCDDETSDIMKLAGQTAGFKVWKRLVWDKKMIGMGYHYRARYEFILFMEKGKRRLRDLGIPDVLEAKRIKHKDAYPAEKPVAINKILTGQSTELGEVICDPFVGSGSAGVAALESGRRFLGNDLSPSAVEHARRRLDGI
jgi:site-specific DNA-methyltransferase (adenine-specific)